MKRTADEALADIVLAEGLDALSLRPAAAQLGISDRILVYYFGTKSALMGEVLACASMLDGTAPAMAGILPLACSGWPIGCLTP